MLDDQDEKSILPKVESWWKNDQNPKKDEPFKSEYNYGTVIMLIFRNCLTISTFTNNLQSY
jgi:hypothetical protein